MLRAARVANVGSRDPRDEGLKPFHTGPPIPSENAKVRAAGREAARREAARQEAARVAAARVAANGGVPLAPGTNTLNDNKDVNMMRGGNKRKTKSKSKSKSKSKRIRKHKSKRHTTRR